MLSTKKKNSSVASVLAGQTKNAENENHKKCVACDVSRSTYATSSLVQCEITEHRSGLGFKHIKSVLTYGIKSVLAYRQ